VRPGSLPPAAVDLTLISSEAHRREEDWVGNQEIIPQIDTSQAS
jgi:hypothetical protein